MGHFALTWLDVVNTRCKAFVNTTHDREAKPPVGARHTQNHVQLQTLQHVCINHCPA